MSGRFGDDLAKANVFHSVVEVKRMNQIDSTVEEEMRTKLSRLPTRPGVSARPVLVYARDGIAQHEKNVV